jgi:protein-L-isoaspartate(D-aspartate) O-methyltransferase
MAEAGGHGDDRRVRIAELILRLRRAGVSDQRVVSAIESVPRETFVPAESRAEAYAERALPIDCGQTISAPVIVGMMTAALDVGDRDRVLEIGTGTGYQTAILAKLARRVYTMDRSARWWPTRSRASSRCACPTSRPWSATA